MKTLKITESTHKALSKHKIEAGHKTLDETISNIIKWYEWWIKPGPGKGQGNGNKK